MVADMVADIKANMVADMEVDKVADMVAEMVVSKKRKKTKWLTWSWTRWPIKKEKKKRMPVMELDIVAD